MTFARIPGVTLFVALMLLAAACGSTPTAPTPPPPPPPVVADPPTLACPASIAASTTATTGIAVTFTTPVAEKGALPVTVSCTPPAGETFPIGDTRVECTAKDSLERSATCSFQVSVSRTPLLSKTRFLAFGDSITFGEVTVPVSSSRSLGTPSTRLIQVPWAAYPTALTRFLESRYTTQEDAIIVANYGLGGEKAINARDRFMAALNIVRPEVVLLMEGSNDIARGEDGAASGAAREISVMAAEARLRGMRVLLATVPPGRPGLSKTISPFLIADYNARMRIVAQSQGALLVDIFQALSTDVSRYIGIDGLHPTELGYAKIAETFYNVIRSEFEVR
ncbi:MAG: GDSL-type esterase/lipase family protein [Acidobacteriota bacterium]|nr:GDSL-type esterase/lipase family protein [Acidobacteriota bacterium]